MNDKSTIEHWLDTRAPETLRQTPPLLKNGERVDHYEVIAFLDRGGSAEVYRVRDNDLRQDYALKLFTRPTDESARFISEARALARLSHPNLARINTFGETAGHPYFVMELLKPLPDELSQKDVRRIILGVAAGVEALHAAGLIHRDIKRANVLLRGETPVLADLGAIKAISPGQTTEASPTFQATGAWAVGTPGFAAPEQLSGGTITPATDIFALGLFAHTLLEKHETSGWRHVINRATEALPEQRYPTVAAFARAVRFWTMTFPIARRVLLGAVLLGIVGGGLFEYLSRSVPHVIVPWNEILGQPQLLSVITSKTAEEAVRRHPSHYSESNGIERICHLRYPIGINLSIAPPTNRNYVIRSSVPNNSSKVLVLGGQSPDGRTQSIAVNGDGFVVLENGAKVKDERGIEANGVDHNHYLIHDASELHLRPGRKVTSTYLGQGEDPIFYDIGVPSNPPPASVSNAVATANPPATLTNRNGVICGWTVPGQSYTLQSSVPPGQLQSIALNGSAFVSLGEGGKFKDERTAAESKDDHNGYVLWEGAELHLRPGRKVDVDYMGHSLGKTFLYYDLPQKEGAVQTSTGKVAVVTVRDVFEASHEYAAKCERENQQAVLTYFAVLNDVFHVNPPIRLDLSVTDSQFPYDYPILVNAETGGVVIVNGPYPFTKAVRFMAIGSGTIRLTQGAKLWDPRTTDQAKKDHNRYVLEQGTVLHVTKNRQIAVEGEGKLLRDIPTEEDALKHAAEDGRTELSAAEQNELDEWYHRFPDTQLLHIRPADMEQPTLMNGGSLNHSPF